MTNRTIIAILIASIFFASCAREKYYVQPAKPAKPKLMVLEDDKNGKPPASYTVNGERYFPLVDAKGFVQYGKASWYGKKFHGRKTSNGEIYDMYKKSAAHKTIPFNTYIKVINLKNNKETIVKINDRGPFIKGRVVDLSYAAAKEIGLVGPGVVDAKVIVLGKQVGSVREKNRTKPVVELKDLESGEFTVQVGAYRSRDNAKLRADTLRPIFNHVKVVPYKDKSSQVWHKVQVSNSETLNKAIAIEKKLEEMGFADAFIVRL